MSKGVHAWARLLQSPNHLDFQFGMNSFHFHLVPIQCSCSIMLDVLFCQNLYRKSSNTIHREREMRKKRVREKKEYYNEKAMHLFLTFLCFSLSYTFSVTTFIISLVKT